MKKRNGTKTVHPGVRRLDKRDYLIRASMRCPMTGKQIEKERRLTNTPLQEAVKARILLLQDIEAELERQTVDAGKVKVNAFYKMKT